MALCRSDFGTNPNLGAQRNTANGWVGVWPGGIPASHLGVARAAGVAIPVQRGLVPLVETLLVITEVLGYDVKPGQSWGYANRPIRGTNVPSNHSRGKAVDINSLANPMQAAFRTDIPVKVVHAWEACHWYWGGRYLRRPDAMHFEYLGRPGDVAGDLATARSILARLRPATWQDRVDAKPGARVIARWSVGTDVALVQRFLAVTPADGRYGLTTVAAVKAYQGMRGLKVDGICGPATWAPILRDLGLTP